MSSGRRLRLQRPAFRFSILTILMALLHAVPARAQPPPPPIGPFVVDLRGSLARLGQYEALAENLELSPTDLPSRGTGFDIAGHWYFFTYRAITFGIGGNLQLSGAVHHIIENPLKPEIEPTPRVVTQLITFTPQLSFNFGTGNGWSYLSGGMSPVRLRVSIDGVEQEIRSTKTINYGGGGRWFATPHLAFTFDLRFYGMSPLEEDEPFPGLPRMTLLVFSVGVSIK